MLLWKYVFHIQIYLEKITINEYAFGLDTLFSDRLF